MFCSVLPYTRSLDERPLTYAVPHEYIPFIQQGSSVVIPWWDDTIVGIVADIGPHIPPVVDVKNIHAPHCTTPWLSPREIALALDLARTLFVRIHTILQLFIPEWVFHLFEKENFISLLPPQELDTKIGGSEYSIAPDESTLRVYLAQTLEYTPGAVILPDGVSVRAWSESFPGAFIDIHPRSLPAQKKNYLALLGENPLVFGTRRMLTKRLGRYKHLYVVYDNLPGDIVFKQRTIPLWMMLDKLERYGHVIHYITTTPHVRTFYDFLQHKKQIHYL